MAHFAEVKDGIVQQVIVADQEYIDALENKDEWVQTSYNTLGGVHTLGGTPLRKNFAGIGFTYDSERDAFISPKPYASWVLNEETCLWEAPIVKPTGENIFLWDEETTNWVEQL